MQIPSVSAKDKSAADSEASALPKTRGFRRHYLLVVLLFVYAMSMIDRHIMGVLIQPIKEEFGVSDSAMGLLTGLAFALFYSILAVPFGRLADRSNRRNLVSYCCLAWSLATALCGMALGFWSLVGARVAVAVGEAGGTAPSGSMIADVYPPEQRSRAMSIFMLGPHFGTLFGLGLGAWIAQQYGWRQAFLSLAIPGIVAALLLRFTCSEPERGAQQRDPQALAEKAVGLVTERFGDVVLALRKNAAFVGLGLASLLLAFAGYAIGMWNTSFLVRSHSLSLKDAGALMGIFGGGAAIIGAVLSGWLTDRMAKRSPGWQIGVPVLGVLASVPFGLYFYMAPASTPWAFGGLQIPHSMPAYLVFAVLSSFWVAPTYAALTNVVPAKYLATALAIYNLLVTAAGGGLGPLTAGMLSDALSGLAGVESLRWALVCMLAFYLVAVAAYALTLKSYVNQIRTGQSAGVA
ncbi:MFS transporter [Comamonas aquatilis]|uniref:spinster family MFS transporter n=1 Tax=Comamonas aquatilis TaxID=1778406 RepID=UPI0039F0F7C0